MKRDQADALFSRFIKLLSAGYCKRCGKYLGVKSRGLHCAHWYSRGNWTTRFERDNAQACCYGCHRYLDQHPAVKSEFFLEILGIPRGTEINTLAHKTLKDLGLSKESLKRQVIADLKAKIKVLEAK